MAIKTSYCFREWCEMDSELNIHVFHSEPFSSYFLEIRQLIPGIYISIRRFSVSMCVLHTFCSAIKLSKGMSQGESTLVPHNALSIWLRVKGTPPKVKGHPEVNLPYKCPMVTKFGRKHPWSKCNALQGSKVMYGSAAVNQRSNYLEMPYGYQLW